ncbi:MAG: DUF3822 family protein [Crocinitomicaceae bacterium]|jgi:hypothetical protein|nr:DUF3822 family protein [Crocinitomicaceae bacterium]
MSKQLVVHLDRNSVRFQRLVDGQVEQDFLFHFTDKTDFGYKDQLDAFLLKTDFRTMDWDEYSLSWFSEKSTLLPYNLFGITDTTKAFQLSFGTRVDENDIDFNRIPEYTVVNLFEIPLWVKSFFISRFPRMTIQHAGSHAIRGVFTKGAFGLKLLILPFKEHFMLMAVKNNDLQFYNIFDCQSHEDILYHTAHLVQQLNLKGEKGKCILCNSIEDMDLVEPLSKVWNKIDLLKSIELTEEKQLLTEYQTLCV